MAFNRVVILVDMDCFYVQVEQRREPSSKGKPCAVVQYRKHRGGGIIAVGYEARACGVTRRGMMGDDARALCPDIILFRVPVENGKANLDRYREAGAEVINVLSHFGGRVERASIDEAYIDITDVVNKIISQKKEKEYLDPEKLPNTHIVGWPKECKEGEDKAIAREEGAKRWVEEVGSGSQGIEDVRLAIAAVIAEEIRAAVYHQTGFRCSAGISHNKMLSKLICGINKPNKQTVLSRKSITDLFKTMKIGKVRNLGGKLGKLLVSNFEIEFMSQLADIPMDKLIEVCGSKSACWLKEVCHGIDHEPVKERHLAQSIGCGKNFNGPEILNTKAKVEKWMDTLLIELSGRLDKDKAANSRVARSLSVHVRLETGQSFSRSGPLLKYDRGNLLKQCMQLIRSLDSTSSQDQRWRPAISSLSVNAKKFDPIGGSILSHTTSPTTSKPFSIIESQSTVASTSNLKSKNAANPLKAFFGNKVSKDQQIAPANEGSEPGVNASNEIFDKFPPKLLVPESSLQNPSKASSSNGATHRLEDFFANKGPSNKQTTVGNCSDIKVADSLGTQIKKADNTSKEHSEKSPFELFFSKSENPVQTSSMGAENEAGSSQDNDVIFVNAQQPLTQSKKSFFTPTPKKKELCKIDEMLVTERENTQPKRENTQPKTSNIDLPDGPVIHPLYGEIDRDVFSDLPPDIQEEIARSYKITSSVIPSSQTPTSSQNSSKSSDRNQRLISNFIPLSQNTSQKFETPSPLPKEKRKAPNPSPVRAKKQKISPRTTKSPRNRSKAPVFTSKPKNDALPLGFFRQRTQLTDAISKALTKKPPKFLH